MVLHTFVPIDQETLENMKRQSDKYVSILGFSCADKVSFVFIESSFDSSHFYWMRQSLSLGGTIDEVIAKTD